MARSAAVSRRAAVEGGRAAAAVPAGRPATALFATSEGVRGSENVGAAEPLKKSSRKQASERDASATLILEEVETALTAALETERADDLADAISLLTAKKVRKLRWGHVSEFCKRSDARRA